MADRPPAVRLSCEPSDVDLDRIAAQAHQVAGRADRALSLAVELGPLIPHPGAGLTAVRWEMLASLAAADLTAARVAEAHLDALAILGESGPDPQRLGRLGAGPGSTWGVFAAESPGLKVEARPVDDGWLLTGTKPWCSLADRLSHALITAHTEQGSRLFAIGLRTGGTTVPPNRWQARGLVDVPSGPIELQDVPAEPVGPAGWYLERPGFAWGGIGVAACWYGGAVGVARALFAAARSRAPDQIGQHQLGAVDSALHRARCVLAGAAVAVDRSDATGETGVILAARARDVVAAAAEEVLIRVGHALGPAPLALDAEHARRVADLQLYLRQQHAERDQAALGRALLARDQPW